MSKENHTDVLLKAIASEPPGTYKKFIGEGTGIENNLPNFIQNMPEVGGRVEHAWRSGCWIEAISLRHQEIDYWLRVYFVNNALPGENRPWESGRLLNRCRELGLDSDLHRRLSDFNKRRTDAVHNYVVGSITYAALKPIVKETVGLPKELAIYVLEHSGEIMTPTSSHPGYAGFLVNVPQVVTKLSSASGI
jgi:hypothetical protein